jgi:hypothetical protein
LSPDRPPWFISQQATTASTKLLAFYSGS